MIFPSNRVRIVVATRPVDFRKQHDGLVAHVKNVLRKDPFTGTVFLFRAKRADRLKLHKSQGSKYPAVVIPVLTQHYAMLRRNLLYTGVTRGKRLVVMVGQKKAVAIAVRNASGRRRWSKLDEWLAGQTEVAKPGISAGAGTQQGSTLTGAMPYG